MISVIIVNQGSTKIKNKRGKNVDRHDATRVRRRKRRGRKLNSWKIISCGNSEAAKKKGANKTVRNNPMKRTLI